MTIIERIFKLMSEQNIRPVDMANELNISKGVISNWKRRGTNPPAEYLKKISTLLNVSLEFLLTGSPSDTSETEEIRKIVSDALTLTPENINKLKLFVDFLKYSEVIIDTNKISENDSKKILPLTQEPQEIEVPMKGYVAAGQPIDLPDDYTFNDMVALPRTKEASQADFALQVKGDSMEPEINDGDIILVKMQPHANDGQIVIASIDHSATLKKLYKFHDRIELHALNRKYDPIVIDNEYTDFRILGIKL